MRFWLKRRCFDYHVIFGFPHYTIVLLFHGICYCFSSSKLGWQPKIFVQEINLEIQKKIEWSYLTCDGLVCVDRLYIDGQNKLSYLFSKLYTCIINDDKSISHKAASCLKSDV